MKERITVTDIIITLLVIVFSVFVALHLTKSESNEYLEIKSPAGTYLYPLSADAVYSIEGKIGTSIITVENSRVSISDSPCPNKTCVSDGSISEPGEFLACLPNCISVTVTGKGGADVVSF